MLSTRVVTLRWLAVVALVGLAPAMLRGGICIPTDGCGMEMGGCACIGLPWIPSPAAFAGTAASECGPCSDETFSALRGGHAPAPQILSPPVVRLLPIATAALCAGRAGPTASDPSSRERNRVLRC